MMTRFILISPFRLYRLRGLSSLTRSTTPVWTHAASKFGKNAQVRVKRIAQPDVDFRFQPSIDKRQVRDFATLTFVTEAANILLLSLPAWARRSGRRLRPARDR